MRLVMRLAVTAFASVLIVTFLTATGDAPVQAGSGPSCGGERPVGPNGGTYSCTFTEDFTGSSIDSDTWMTQDTSYSGMTTASKDCFVDSPQNVGQSGGAAHITAVRLSSPTTCKSPYGNFTTQTTAGTIATRTHFDQAFGRFEFRARFPKETGAGVHAALWLYPAKNTYGAWPKSGEIDVAEWFSNYPHLAIPSAHYQGEVPLQSSGLTCQTMTPQSYHTYAVDWGKDGVLRYYLDNRLCWQHDYTVHGTLSGLAPFDQPFYIVLSMAFGDGANAPTALTPDRNTMDVDWVRAWSWTPPAASSSRATTDTTRAPALGNALRLVRH